MIWGVTWGMAGGILTESHRFAIIRPSDHPFCLLQWWQFPKEPLMSAIFKTRKIQRHLVIQPELPVSKRKRRWLLRRLSLILLMGFVLTWLLFQIG